MSLDWKGLIGQIAPAIAGTFGTPLMGAGVKFLCDAVGLTGADATEEKLEAKLATADPELLLKIKVAGQEFQAKMAELGVRLEELSTKDRDSARAMQVQTRSRMPAILSAAVVIMTTTIYGYLVMGDYDKLTLSELILGRILGTLDMAFGVVLAYWLGAAHREIANRTPNGK